MRTYSARTRNEQPKRVHVKWKYLNKTEINIESARLERAELKD